MHTVSLKVPGGLSQESVIERLESAGVAAGLRITMRTTLRSYPGCTHWHFKSGSLPGTLELTYWPRQSRAWFSVQSRRKADWMDRLLTQLRRHIDLALARQTHRA